jgi:hypothetical protein
MLIAGDNRMSRLSSCLDAAGNFLLSRKEAIEIVESQLGCISEHWYAVCDEASLTETDRAFLSRRQFLNPYAFEDLDGDAANIKAMADRVQPVARAPLSHFFSKFIIRCIAWIQTRRFPFDSKSREFLPYAA